MKDDEEEYDYLLDASVHVDLDLVGTRRQIFMRDHAAKHPPRIEYRVEERYLDHPDSYGRVATLEEFQVCLFEEEDKYNVDGDDLYYGNKWIGIKSDRE